MLFYVDAQATMMHKPDNFAATATSATSAAATPAATGTNAGTDRNDAVRLQWQPSAWSYDACTAWWTGPSWTNTAADLKWAAEATVTVQQKHDLARLLRWPPSAPNAGLSPQRTTKAPMVGGSQQYPTSGSTAKRESQK